MSTSTITRVLPASVSDHVATQHVTAHPLGIQLLGPAELPAALADLANPHYVEARKWLAILAGGLGHQPYCVRAVRDGQTVGLLPLAFVKSALFGRFLVSLPYVNSAGVIATDEDVAQRLLDEAVRLADKLDVRYLELRQQREMHHAAFTHANQSKVLMRLRLPGSSEELWTSFKSKLRSQIKAGQKHQFEVAWGGKELLPEFYAVFSQNMRDLGTPVFPTRLFNAILEQYGSERSGPAAEFCVVRSGQQAIAAALLIHSDGVTEVPSASSLRTFNDTNCNMVLYWSLLSRAIERGQQEFDFGRSSTGSGTYRFKEQWGAQPSPSVWQYYLRRGTVSDMRPDNAKFGLAIKLWRRLPVPLTRWLGPMIVRGIP